ncbi:VIT1/CCC1 transporter family protein [Lactobacillus selangorensis]|nr:VIT1/CCC1 transporter family protein [Lactobacillus selangorensis]
MIELFRNITKTKLHFWDSLNVVRAGILGANDGIISVSGIVLGAAAANLSGHTLFISGISGMLAGACSMAGGEYISVSAQKEVQLKRLDEQEVSDEQDQEILHEIDLMNPIHAAAMSFMSFILGALIPLLAISLSPARWRVLDTALAMVVALAINALIGYTNTNTSKLKAILQNVAVGLFTTVVTYLIGMILGVAVSA